MLLIHQQLELRQRLPSWPHHLESLRHQISPLLRLGQLQLPLSWRRLLEAQLELAQLLFLLPSPWLRLYRLQGLVITPVPS